MPRTTVPLLFAVSLAVFFRCFRMDEGKQSFVSHKKLGELVRQVDHRHELDPEVADLVLELADSFVESAIRFGSQLARHRGDDTLKVRDISLYLETTYKIRVPGFCELEPPAKVQKREPASDSPSAKSPVALDVHMNRNKSRASNKK